MTGAAKRRRQKGGINNNGQSKSAAKPQENAEQYDGPASQGPNPARGRQQPAPSTPGVASLRVASPMSSQRIKSPDPRDATGFGPLSPGSGAHGPSPAHDASETPDMCRDTDLPPCFDSAVSLFSTLSTVISSVQPILGKSLNFLIPLSLCCASTRLDT